MPANGVIEIWGSVAIDAIDADDADDSGAITSFTHAESSIKDIKGMVLDHTIGGRKSSQKKAALRIVQPAIPLVTKLILTIF